MAIPLLRRRVSFVRLCFLVGVLVFFRLTFFSSSHSSSHSFSTSHSHQIEEHNFIERNTRPDKSLNVQKHKFLQARMGREERDDWLNPVIRNGMEDYWDRFQLPYILNRDTSAVDAQHVSSAIEQLLSLNGWVAALCTTLTRPFGQNKNEDLYDELIRQDHLYFIAIVIHSADHFLVDQLAVIVQLAKRLGTNNIFVSMLDYDSVDSTETLTDLCEATLTLLGVPFRIRRVPGMTEDAAAAYYPLEEAHMRNLALEPLKELDVKRGIRFHRVIWLKGFTCPNDILETIKVSFANEAAMVCGMDWAEHNGFFIFSDRWRTRDIEGDQFRQSKSSSKPDAVPPRDKVGAARYAQHLPFQVFCCESGTHVVDPAQSYYKGISYRAGTDFQNLSRSDPVVDRGPNAPCLDSSQAWFCRDLWVGTARDGMQGSSSNGFVAGIRKRMVEVASRDPLMYKARGEAREKDGAVVRLRKREEPVEQKEEERDDKAGENVLIKEKDGDGVREADVHVIDADGMPKKLEEVDDDARPKREAKVEDADANAGSDYDAISDEEGGGVVPKADHGKLSIPNSVFRPAKILVNPRCPTTYAGVSHTQLALDLFGDGDDIAAKGVRKYVLENWEGAPESFVCQEQRQTGGRKAPKTQRRLGFSIHDELQK
ncbi:hypothetical protein E1B28_003304 [Marasmius oreades]|uniref:Glycosyltransferase family 69 protein n=1 Tax=Marasmius oreades TaxID=181124 RepID=A0A9P7RMA8_9AGAR|nr:uncharacterized protein E1B28_003304 [Marasmius oreades]KAG7085763.1 hypothetical protein E1B28_003304 [Marasmius oreades]